jgi:hypothetical protein
MDRMCNQLKADGTPCRAKALPNRDKCFFHAEETASVRDEGRRLGGLTRSRPAATLPPDTPECPLETVHDVCRAVSATFNQVRRGEIDSRVGNSLGLLAGLLLRAMEATDLEKRLTALEARLDDKERRGR